MLSLTDNDNCFDIMGDIQCEIEDSFPIEEAYDETDWLKEYEHMLECIREQEEDEVEQKVFCIRIDRFGDECGDIATQLGEFCGRCMEIESGMYNEDEYYF